MSKRLKFDVEKSVDILSKFPVFIEFSKEELIEFLSLKGYTYIFKHHKDEILIYESRYDCWVFWLLSGQIRVTKKNELLTVLSSPGEVFGEMGPINEDPRSATLTAETDVTTLGLDLSILDQITQEKRSLFHKKLKEIAIRRMNKANDTYIAAINSLRAEKDKNKALISFIHSKGLSDELHEYNNISNRVVLKL